MRKCLIFAAVAVISNAFALAAWADCPGDLQPGVWVPGEVTNSPPACSRLFYCNPEREVTVEGCFPVPSPPVSVVGECSAAGGDPGSCNECLTGSPQEPCQWHLQQNQ